MAKASRHFQLNLLDVDKLVKQNDLKEITNPIFFTRDNAPTPDGLLSNEIFGITKDQRASTFAYINLNATFLHPLYYKIWSRTDRKIKNVVHGTENYKVNAQGELVEDEDGESGIQFLKKNIGKIKLKRNDSIKRNRNIEFLEKNKNLAFITKIPVIPAYYRDVNSATSGRTGVGEINKLYNQIMICARSIKESEDYGLSFSSANMGRLQELLLSLYDWFGAGTVIAGEKTSVGIPSKFGIIRRSNLSKTADYSSRVILSAPQLKVESVDDLEVTVDTSAVSLASVLTNFYPFMMFGIRTFFENEFAGKSTYDVYENGKLVQYPLGNWQSTFSDDNIKREIERFLKGYSNRLVPIDVPIIENNKQIMINMRLIGYNIKAEEFDKETIGKDKIVNRRLTWCDVFFMVAVDVVRDKHILITRFPMDSYYNQFPTKITVSSTVKTEQMYFPNTLFETKYYKRYPYIRENLIGTNTSNMFVDTLNISNVHLGSIGGDYDGDQVTIKGVYSNESNAELEKYMNSKSFHVDLGGRLVRNTTKEGLQSLYSLTLVLPESNLTDKVE